MESKNDKNRLTGLEIAVIGMAGRFPGANTIDEFWENIKNGRESISFFTDEELEAEGISRDVLADGNYIKARGVLADIESFDFSFFGYIPTEAEMMDPQVRIFHECAWEAIENAGYSPEGYAGLIGLYAGATPNVAWTLRTLIKARVGLEQFSAGNLDSTSFSTLISYRLNIKGSSVTVQTACSTSLTAIHLACRSLLMGEVDMAMAGGISINLPRRSGYFFREGMIVSRDGHCRAFDADASGTVSGNGVGVVVLKSLGRAIEDGDHIYAIVKGSAANNDGNRKVGYTAPSVEGEADVIRAALEMAEVEPDSIGYIETHGTGTSLGDPIEIEALKLAFATDKKGFCPIGSVKSNTGHLDRASGVTGFIKTVLILYHKMIPASLHYKRANPKIDFANSPFYVNTGLQEWKRVNGMPRRAGVSSFGIGGTNVHVVLEEAPGMEETNAARNGVNEKQLLVFSAKTGKALERMTVNLGKYLGTHAGLDLANVAYTLQTGRSEFKYRRILLSASLEEAASILERGMDGLTAAAVKWWSGMVKEGKKRIVFMFPGQGAQYVDMGKELYQEEAVFRNELSRCLEILKALMGFDVEGVLYPLQGKAGAGEELINRTEITQPLVFAFSYALARLLMQWGVQPVAMIGHSIGEYVAACLAGVFSIEDGLRLVVMRGKLMGALPGGDMLSVPLEEGELKEILAAYPGVDLAAINTGNRCVVSGKKTDIEMLMKDLEIKGIKTRILHTSHAFHSAMMDPVLGLFEKEVRQVKRQAPQIPYISNLTGAWITVEQVQDPGYWVNHLRRTVRFADGIAKLKEQENTVFIEVGPGKTLSTFVRQQENNQPPQLVLHLVRHPDEKTHDRDLLLEKIGTLWLNGVKIDWQGYYRYRQEKIRQRVILPAYPFEKTRVSVDTGLNQFLKELGARGDVMAREEDLANWFYIPSWKRVDCSGYGTQSDKSRDKNFGPWLVLADNCGLGEWLAGYLRQEGKPVWLVEPGASYEITGEYGRKINAAEPGDYEHLLTDMKDSMGLPGDIIHAWGVTGMMNQQGNNEENGEAFIQGKLNTGFYALLYLAQALGKISGNEKIRFTAITDHLWEVTGNEIVEPIKAVIPAVLRVMGKEYKNISCTCIDIEAEEAPGKKYGELIINELFQASGEEVIALRGKHRWAEWMEQVRLEDKGKESERLKEGGVYLVTGGFGGMGLTVSQYLAKTFKAKLILVGRTSLPAREQWEEALAVHGTNSGTGYKIKKIEELETLGAEVLVFDGNVADQEVMARILDESIKRFGEINGIFHTAGIGDYAGLIQRRNREETEAVLAAKIKGTWVLEKLLEEKNIPVEIFVLFSSLSAYLGPAGQVGYTAANAFQDAFAQWKNQQGNRYTISINWDSWQEVGMAVEAVKKMAVHEPGETKETRFQPIEHPLFNQRFEDESHRHILVMFLQAEKHWMVFDHQILGKPVLPGTGYLEILTAAFPLVETGYKKENEDILITNFYLLTPLTVEENEKKEVRTIFEKQAQGYEATITSRSFLDKNQWVTHARGTITRVPAEDKIIHDINGISGRCNTKEASYPAEGKAFGRGFISFGPRWDNLKKVRLGQKEGLARVELPEAFNGDIGKYGLHPALMDTATAFLVGEVRDKDITYLPFSFQQIRIKSGLPGTFWSYSRCLNLETRGTRSLDFDIVIMDEQGEEHVVIHGFTVMGVKREQGAVLEPDMAGKDTKEKPGALTTGITSNDLLKNDLLKNAIRPAEGIEIIKRTLGSGYTQVLVSAMDWHQRLKRSQNLAKGVTREGMANEGMIQTIPGGEEISIQTSYGRPELTSPYLAPENDIEEKLARVWQQFFRIAQIGVMDDFFELGGDSLKALSLLSRIHKELSAEITLAAFFNHPTIQALATIIQTTGITGITGTMESKRFIAIEPTEAKEYYPASAAQKRLFFIHHFDPASPTYNIPTIVVLEGKLEKEKLEQVFNQLIQRHEILRTGFEMIGEIPVQRIAETWEFKLEYVNLWEPANLSSGLPLTPSAPGVQNEVKAFIRPFDLSQPPLVRLRLVQLDRESYVFMLDIHHIVFDATSFGIIMTELMALMGGNELAALKLQYRDYSEWQNHGPGKEIMEKQEAYWLQQFQGDNLGDNLGNNLGNKPDIPMLELPLDFPRPPITGYEGDSTWFEINAKETAALKTLARQSSVTLFHVLYAIYAILLSKLSGQEDIVVGVPVAGRHHADLEKMVGMFVNALCIRTFPAGNKVSRDYLQEVKNEALAGFENQDYQYEELLDRLGETINRDTSRNPLYDVIFNMRNMSYEPLEIPGLTMKPMDWKMGIAKFDLSFIVVEGTDTLSGYFEFSTRLFKKETVVRFSRYWQNLATAILNDIGQKLADLEVMTATEKQKLLEEWNDTARIYPVNKTLDEIFEEQVKHYPGQVAVVGESHLTYRELDNQANFLAEYLLEKGVREDSIVALMTEPGMFMMIMIMGILKAGGAYLPLDPGLPEVRIGFMLRDSATPILLTHTGNFPSCQAFTDIVDIVNIMDILSRYQSQGKTRVKILPGTASSQNLAYVIYTSGTTGTPKGTLISHYNVSRVVMETNYIQFRYEDRVLQLSNYAFDGSVFDIFGALLNGATLVIMDRSGGTAVDRLADVIVRECITIFFITAALFSILADYRLDWLNHIRYVVAGGEAVSITHARQALKYNSQKYRSQAKIINGYGPTETTVFATTYEINTLDEKTTNIPIGQPLANTTVYILDKYLHPAAIGIPGELYIGGKGVSRGYLNQPVLTAERFIPSPFTPDSAPLYKSGDLVRWLDNGNIEFLGRLDNQVKIRGFRIELSEIEHQLSAYTSIKKALVRVHQEKNQTNQFLSAYVVAEQGFDLQELKSFLSSTMPHYMIPAYFFEMEEFPLTTNGKIDIRRLPIPGEKDNVKGIEKVTDILELQLVATWSHVLGIDKNKLGRHSDFFRAGGHSLKATVLAAKIRETFQVDMSLSDIFTRPNLAEMADFIRQAIPGTKQYKTIEQVENKEYYLLSSAQKRLYVIQQMDKEAIGYNLPMLMILSGNINIEKLETVFLNLVQRHESLRTAFIMLGQEPVQIIHDQVEFFIETRDRVEGFVRPFNLSQAPLLRVGLMEKAQNEWIWMMDMHHIISDGTSMGILTREFAELYQGKTLAPVPLQYRDYAEWQRKQDQENTSQIQWSIMGKQEQYWLNRFSDEFPITEFPLDFPRPALRHYEGKLNFFNLDPAMTALIKKLCQETGTTVYMVLLAAFNIVLARYSMKEDIIVGTGTAGRRHAGLLEIVGMFVNMLPIRNQPQGKKTFIEFLQEVKINALEGFENQDYPFDTLVEKLGIRVDGAKNPLFNVEFTIQNTSMSEVSYDIPELEVKPYGDTGIAIAKFDFSLQGVEKGEEIGMWISYSPPLFKSDTIEQFIAHFQEVLGIVLANREVKLKDIHFSHHLSRAEVDVKEEETVFGF